MIITWVDNNWSLLLLLLTVLPDCLWSSSGKWLNGWYCHRWPRDPEWTMSTSRWVHCFREGMPARKVALTINLMHSHAVYILHEYTVDCTVKLKLPFILKSCIAEYLFVPWRRGMTYWVCVLGFCDFEMDLCGWLNRPHHSSGEDWDWTSATASGMFSPDVDHTTNSALGRPLEADHETQWILIMKTGDTYRDQMVWFSLFTLLLLLSLLLQC